jgi:hypothetical protein
VDVFLDANGLIGTIGALLGDCFWENILVIFSKKSSNFKKNLKELCVLFC